MADDSRTTMNTSGAVGGISSPSKAWSGRFAVSSDKRLEAFNASVTFDVRMIREDIRASIAHARMLGRQAIIDQADADAIIDGLWTILDEVDRDAFALTVDDEDVHTGVERRLRELIGPTAGKLHTGRSRNDQVANDLRFWTRGALVQIAQGLVVFGEALLGVAERHPDAVMPGYTHLQRAQPVMLGHHLLAYVEMALRDIDRVQEAHRRTNVLALGSGALAGTSFPIDREAVAEELGFQGITANSLDGVSDRDFVLDALYACSVVAMHISRLSEEVILWSSGEFRFAELDDAFSTGSSIMPQKKNADIAELSRGKSGRVFGNLFGLLTTLKGLPLAYNKDMQEDKEGLFDSVDTILAVLAVFPPMLTTMRFDKERLAAAAVADFSLATDAADLLARHGVPFREAHGIVGRLVAACIREGRTFADLSDTEWAAAHPIFADQRPPLDALASASLRDIPGGTAPRQVALQLAAAKDRLRGIGDWCAAEREREISLFTRT
jgi:argininosuccinate lyase